MTDMRPGDVVATYAADAGYAYRAELHGAEWRILRLMTPPLKAGLDASDPVTPQEQAIRDPSYWAARGKAVGR